MIACGSIGCVLSCDMVMIQSLTDSGVLSKTTRKKLEFLVGEGLVQFSQSLVFLLLGPFSKVVNRGEFGSILDTRDKRMGTELVDCRNMASQKAIGSKGCGFLLSLCILNVSVCPVAHRRAVLCRLVATDHCCCATDNRDGTIVFSQFGISPKPQNDRRACTPRAMTPQLPSQVPLSHPLGDNGQPHSDVPTTTDRIGPLIGRRRMEQNLCVVIVPP